MPGEFAVKLYNGLHIYIHDPSHEYVSRMLQANKIWEKNITIFTEYLSKGGVYIDVGANIGYYSLVASRKYEKIYAFEPIPQNYELLQKSLKENGISNVTLIPKCVGKVDDSTTMLTIYPHNMGICRDITATYGSEANVINTNCPSTEFGPVEIISLDTFTYNIQSIDFLKIDVEGFEFEVFKGFMKGLRSQKAKVIVFELSPLYIAKEKCIQMLNLLKINNYYLFDIGVNDSEHNMNNRQCIEITNVDFDMICSNIRQTNILAVTQDRKNDIYKILYGVTPIN